MLAQNRVVMVSGRVMAEPTTTAVAPRLKGVLGVRGVGDVAFQEYGYCQVRHEGLEQGPGRGADAGGFGGVAVEGGGDGVGSGTFGGEGVFEGGDVGEDWAVEVGVDAGDQFGPGFGGGEAASGAVEGDDVGSGVADGLGGAEVGSDVDVSVGVVGLDDADDGKLREGAEGGDARVRLRRGDHLLRRAGPRLRCG